MVRSGTYYDVWERDPSASTVVGHWPLGTHSDPAAPAPCQVVNEAIAAAGPGGRVLAAPRPPIIDVSLSASFLPEGWFPGKQPGSVSVTRGGSTTIAFSLPTSSTYQADLGGSFWGGVSVTIDGKDWYADRARLNWDGYGNPMPAIALTAGPHTLTVSYDAGWGPGGGYTPSEFGPVILSTSRADVEITSLAPSAAQSLCGQRLDWLEAVKG